jgi:hypothetical protein
VTHRDREIVAFFILGLLFLVAQAWIQEPKSAAEFFQIILSHGGGALIVAAVAAFVVKRTLLSNSFESIGALIAEKFTREYSEEITSQLLNTNFLRQYVKCVVNVRPSQWDGWILADVEYEFLCENVSAKTSKAEIRYILEKKLGSRGTLHSIDYELIEERTGRIRLQGAELEPFKQEGPFGTRFACTVDVNPHGRLWAKTTSTELHPDNSEIFLTCYQPTLGLTVDLIWDKRLLDTLEFAPEFLHPRASPNSTPIEARDEGSVVFYSYRVPYPCLPYQGLKLFIHRKNQQLPAGSA